MAIFSNDYTTTTATDSTGGTFWYPPPCYLCGFCRNYGSPCVPKAYALPPFTLTPYPPDTQPTPEEPVQDNLIDKSLADELTAMRDRRDSAARYAQTKNDMASLYEAAAVFLRTQADMMYREINEGVPMTPDPK